MAVAATAHLWAWAAFAHDGHPHPPTLAQAWTLSPMVLVPFVLLAALYALGLVRLWRQAGIGRGVSVAGVGGFWSGQIALALAAIWPLDAYGAWSLAAHMAQHMLLLALVPPLLLAGKPFAVAAYALPRRWSSALHAGLHAPLTRISSWLVPAAVAHSAVMWAWHLPAALEAVLASAPLHHLMHLSFLLAGMWFWAAAWRRLRDPGSGAGGGVVALLAVMMQMGFLGALLAFSQRALYPVYALRAPEVGLSALADQQLAGILMWVPSCIPYLAGGLWLLWQGLGRNERRNPTPETGP
ncbi:cytochrome c oxidase assembly protein [Luteimonas yindakuii]|uniref:Cytochrome c oxidase assembly protein n=2 Tax=Luteimonas yindakuii TaxID=2565782 RepID=A0A4Z1RL01_9GAMM|nr:cytochrome c oxidase assembly protein [Luteimonas yindakuii]